MNHLKKEEAEKSSREGTRRRAVLLDEISVEGEED